MPNGWHWEKLGGLGTITDGDWILTADYTSSGVRLLQVGDVGVGRFIGKSSRYISESRAESLSCTKLATGDILISRMPEPLGRACVLPDLGYPCITAVDVSICRISKAIVDRDYLLHYLSSPEWFAKAYALASGATRPRISRSNLELIEVPLPPLPEQKRIASKLNACVAALDMARIGAQEQLKAAQQAQMAFLNACFGVEQIGHWPTSLLGDVAEIASGVTLGRNLDEKVVTSIPYLRVANVKDGYLDLTDVKVTAATAEEIEALSLRYGDVLMTEGGDPDKLGRGTFWQSELPVCIHQNHIFRVRFDLGTVDPEFVSLQLASAYGKGYFLTHAKQTTGIATINKKVVRNFPLMLPPLAVQQEVARICGEVSAQINTAMKSTQSQLATLQSLSASILNNAFIGEL